MLKYFSRIRDFFYIQSEFVYNRALFLLSIIGVIFGAHQGSINFKGKGRISSSESCLYTCIYMFTHVHTGTYMYTHAHTCTYTHAHTCAHMHIHVHTCTYMYTHAHTYMYTQVTVNTQ
jgi:hypothetical protein